MNSDGRPDLATANHFSGLSVRLGNGQGSFGSHVEYSAGHGPTALALGDLSGDGELDAVYDDDFITVVIPEFVVSHWWEQLLHNQSALVLKAKLLFRPHTVVTSIPVHLDTARLGDDAAAQAAESLPAHVAPISGDGQPQSAEVMDDER